MSIKAFFKGFAIGSIFTTISYLIVATIFYLSSSFSTSLLFDNPVYTLPEGNATITCEKANPNNLPFTTMGIIPLYKQMNLFSLKEASSFLSQGRDWFLFLEADSVPDLNPKTIHDLSRNCYQNK